MVCACSFSFVVFNCKILPVRSFFFPTRFHLYFLLNLIRTSIILRILHFSLSFNSNLIVFAWCSHYLSLSFSLSVCVSDFPVCSFDKKWNMPNLDDDSDADEITDYLNTNSNESKNEPASSSLQPIYSSKLNTERDLNHSSSSCSSSSTNSARNNHIGRKKTYAALIPTAKMVINTINHDISIKSKNQQTQPNNKRNITISHNKNASCLFILASAFASTSGVTAPTGSYQTTNEK